MQDLLLCFGLPLCLPSCLAVICLSGKSQEQPVLDMTAVVRDTICCLVWMLLIVDRPYPVCGRRSVQEDVYEKDNLQRCLTVFHDFDERLLEVLRDTDPSTVTEHGLYERPVAKMPDEVCAASCV